MTGKQIKPVFARRILAIFSNGYSRGDLGADLRAGVINAINGLLKKEANQLVIAGLKMAARMRTSSSATAVPAGCFYSHISLCAKKRGVFQKRTDAPRKGAHRRIPFDFFAWLWGQAMAGFRRV